MDYKIPKNSKVFATAIFSLIFLTTALSYGQSEIQLQKIKESYGTSKIKSVTTNFKKDFTTKRTRVLSLAKANGWKISETLPNGNYAELQDVGPDGTPIYYTTFNDNVSNVSRANTLYSDGLLNLGINGEGMHVGVWDAGIALTSHQEFDNRVNIADNAIETSTHATMVTGTLIASGIKKSAKGVAHKASATTSDWTRDKIEASEAAANGLLLSNHSYGIKTDRVPDWYFGSYIRVSQDWDNIMFNAPYYLMVTATGNSQNLRDNDSPIHGNAADGFDLILGFAASKNGITVAAADTSIDNNGNLQNASVTNYSSFGPVDDGRIKPDIAGMGSNIYSTNSTGTKSYSSSSGTSMATPGITGSMLLLQQYYESLNESYMKAATLKGLVLHTADDVNELGPDYKMGWGVMNTKRAAEVLVNNDYSSLISEESLAEDEIYTVTVNARDNEPLIASISWTDPASEYINRGVLNDITPALVNDLDIRISSGGKTYYPWKLNAANASSSATKGDNRVDPFEKIEIDNASGEYTITVSHKGLLKAQTQNFSIVISGIALSQCNPLVPSEVIIKEPSEETITLEWEPLLDTLFEIQYRNENTTEWTTSYTYDSTMVIENLMQQTNYEVRLRSFCTENVTSEYTSIIPFIFMGLDTELEAPITYVEFSDNQTVNFSVFPNPAVEKINLDGNLSDKAIYSIVTTMGIVIKEGKANDAEIDVTQLSSGLYIIMVQDLNGIKSMKFYKG